VFSISPRSILLESMVIDVNLVTFCFKNSEMLDGILFFLPSVKGMRKIMKIFLKVARRNLYRYYSNNILGQSIAILSFSVLC
jgi:hypothetical protein